MLTQLLDIKVKRIHKIDNSKHLKAFVDLVVNDVLLIKGIRVIEGQKGIFVSMPQEQAKDKKWYDSVRCLDKEFQDRLQSKVLEAYQGKI